jgi:uncharacterized protein (TIRG00374 family)
MSRSRLILLALGLALSAAAVFFLVRSIDLAAAVRAMEHASLGWIAAGLLVTAFGYYLRALRWREILAPRFKPAVGRLFSATMVGFLAINTLPARIGEFVRAYVLARSERIPTATVLGSLVVERVLDMAMLGIFWALSLLFAPVPEWFRWSGYFMLGAGAALGVVLWGLHAARGRAAGWSESGLGKLVPRRLAQAVSAGIPAFGAGLQAFGSPGAMVKAGLWSVAAWAVSAAVFTLVGLSLGLNLPIWSALPLTFVLCVGISVPSSPGFIGVMEGACVLGLSLLGTRGPKALAFAILYHVTQIVPPLVLGTYFIVRQHITPDILGVRVAPDVEDGRKGRRQ